VLPELMTEANSVVLPLQYRNGVRVRHAQGSCLLLPVLKFAVLLVVL
jgi:hypothetical protein